MTKSKLYVKLHSVIWRNDKGEPHREDEPAVEHSNGHKEWYLNGVCHRDDGPAVEYYSNGTKVWYLNGTKIWYLNGIEYTEQEFNDKIKTLR